MYLSMYITTTIECSSRFVVFSQDYILAHVEESIHKRSTRTPPRLSVHQYTISPQIPQCVCVCVVGTCFQLLEVFQWKTPVKYHAGFRPR